MTRFHSLVVSVLMGIVFMSDASYASQQQCLNMKDQAVLKKNGGVYIASTWLQQTFSARNIFMIPLQDYYVAISISESGRMVILNWHEGFDPWEENAQDYCLTTNENGKLILHDFSNSVTTEYDKLPENVKLFHENHDEKEISVEEYFFNKLFTGCYTDQNFNKLCFGEGQLNFDGKKIRVELHLDSSELEPIGNYLRVQGEPFFWVFIPTSSGWNIHLSDWASKDGYKPIDVKTPWKVLTAIQ